MEKYEIFDDSCLFCKIINKTEPGNIVFENESFVVIDNKYPKAPVHLLVLDRFHHDKLDTISGKFSEKNYFESLFGTIYQVMVKYGLDKTGYKIVNNGAGYHHFSHEHFHILGGSEEEPGGST